MTDGKRKHPYDSRQFITLQKQWYKKLADEGFEDVEHVVGSKTYALTRKRLIPERFVQTPPPAFGYVPDQYVFINLCSGYALTKIATRQHSHRDVSVLALLASGESKTAVLTILGINDDTLAPIVADARTWGLGHG